MCNIKYPAVSTLKCQHILSKVSSTHLSSEKVRSMESTNMGKFKNPLRNLNVIFVIVITIFTGLQLMETEGYIVNQHNIPLFGNPKRLKKVIELSYTPLLYQKDLFNCFGSVSLLVTQTFKCNFTCLHKPKTKAKFGYISP